MSNLQRFVVSPLVLLILSLVLLQEVQADSDHFYPPTLDRVVRKECGGCHMAFPAALLPANSWQRIMADLGNHFGTDATVAPARIEQVRRYFAENAADSGGQRFGKKMLRGVPVDNPPLRITELPKWLHEHRKLPEAKWRSQEVGTKSNCPACHLGAGIGYFED